MTDKVPQNNNQIPTAPPTTEYVKKELVPAQNNNKKK